MARRRLSEWIAGALLVLALASASLLRAAAPEAATAPATPPTQAGAAGVTCRTLCEGTPFATPCYVVSSGKEGPTVLVVAGFHGNEPAGAAAAEDIRRWKVAVGRLVVIPKANKPALDAGTRSMPKKVAPAMEGNLNRDFPSDPAQPIKGPLAQAIWAVVQEMKPDWVIDLHEGTGFSAAGTRTVGSSIIHSGTQKARAMADRMCQAVNETIPEADKKFVLKQLPVEGSLARAAADRRGISSMILETSRGSQPLALRARQHRLMVQRLLTELGMAAGDVDDMPRDRDTVKTD